MSNIYDDVELLQEQMLEVQSNLSELYPVTVAEGADLNDFGVCTAYIPSKVISATILNKPTTSDATAFIRVFKGGNTGMTMQYFPCDKYDPSYYQRSYYNDTWGAWKKINVVDSGWLTLPLASGITAYSDAQMPQYRKIGDVVYIRGAVKGITTNEKVVATLPEGYRPTRAKSYVQNMTASGTIANFTRMQVQADGDIEMQWNTYENNANYWYCLDTEFLVN